MKILLTIVRWIVGLLFIFSGLVKANDPLGLSYKMQEFFEAWGWVGLHDYTLMMSVLMNAFEILAGVAVIVGYRMKLFSWLLLLLIIFFTFLTGYAALVKNENGELIFRSCGCFGDCIPLSPHQSFLKDIVLLVLILFIFYNRTKIQPLFTGKWKFVTGLKMISAVVFAFGLQWYTLGYLPIIDCLPFKKGNNLIIQRQIPPDAMPDKFEYKFIYEKNDETKEFPLTALPDSTWKFKDRKQVLVEKGKNNEPKIKDFNLTTINGVDVTDSVLNQQGNYYMLMIQNTNGVNPSDEWIKQVSLLAVTKKITIVTPQYEAVVNLLKQNEVLGKLPVLVCDVVALKTAARAIPTLYKMNGPLVEGKWSGASFGNIQ